MPLSSLVHEINRSSYKLDLSGVVGLFGGDCAADALETVHLYTGRKWAGWYNYPGTVTVAKRFGRMADGRLWDSLFPGPNESPAKTFNLAGKVGPDYKGSFSGTKLSTDYLGYLMAGVCADSRGQSLQLRRKDNTQARKTGSSATVTVVSLPSRTDERQNPGSIPIIPKYRPPLALWSIIPSLVSVLASVFCFLAEDSLCASLILLGIVSSGFSSLTLGWATLRIHVPVPSPDSPPGDGLMFPEGGNIILLKGNEADVNVVTKGQFKLDYNPNGILSHPKYHMIGITSLLLSVQFSVQLLLIPRCTLFGQILFLVSFVASGVYHLYVVSHEREWVHRELLSQVLSARVEKWTLGTRTQMMVLVCLILGEGRHDPLNCTPKEVLNSIVPNDTAVWAYWKRKVVRELEHFWGPKASLSYDPNIQVAPEDLADTAEYARFTEQEKRLLNDLIDDAWCVFNRYSQWRDEESGIWKDRRSSAEGCWKDRLLGKISVV